jgi:hypothetical protein
MARESLGWIVVSAALAMSSACRESSHVSSAQQPPAQQAARAAVKPVLAKAHLTEASTAAKNWKADAVLIQVAGRTNGDQGLSYWDYGFYSKTATTCLVVRVAATTSAQESGGPMCESDPLAEFMDSDQAIKLARANGITAPSASMVVRMSAMEKPSRPIWSVYDDGGTKPGNVMLDLDATTGAVRSKIVQK